MKTLHIRKGDDIIVEGDNTNFDAYIILEGEIDVTKGGKHLATLSENSLFGEIAMVDDSPRTATCTAKTPKVTLGVVTKENYGRILKDKPGALNPILRLAVERLRNTLERTNEVIKIT
jgi:CRP-like cAMP-binding protein|tara:strand:- start:184 stop:537 length:354 start_codon:yes stop_codon:yes gene_type:complete